MCDYSLHAIRNRLASEGERLVVHRFYTGSIGLAPEPVPVDASAPKQKLAFWRKLFLLDDKSDRPDCAVCIPPGARLVLHNIPAHLQREFGVEETEEVTFTQLSADENSYRDAVRFSSGKTALLQRLTPGQKVEVVSLSGETAGELDPALENVAA